MAADKTPPTQSILGIDEVGRGPWAGPLVVGACILPLRELPDGTPDPAQAWQDQLTDSKKLTKKRRETLNPTILAQATATGLGWVPAAELDQIGLGAALKLATRRAVQAVQAQSPHFTEIIIDGTVNFLVGTPLEHCVTTLKKADLRIKAVSAASIIAKVARDQYMIDLADQYPDYGFEKHVGYGTAAHRAALRALGPTPEHRRSFRPVAAIVPDETATKRLDPATPATTSTATGRTAEARVAAYLQARGHTLLARNYKTKFYEIDLITTKGDNIYFTEVKYRHDSSHGAPLAAITRQKQRQMRFAAEAFLAQKSLPNTPWATSHSGRSPRPDNSALLQPILAAASVSGPDFHVDDWVEIC